MLPKRMASLTLAAILICPAALQGQILYEQAPTTSGGILSNANGVLAADQFVMKETSTITGVRWYGFFQNGTTLPDGELQLFPFHISFFEDRSGVPGQRVSEQEVSVRIRDTGVKLRFNNATREPIPIYEFSTGQLRPAAVKAGETMWISIGAIAPPGPWLWSRSQAEAADTLAVKNESANPAQAMEWQSNGKFGQLAFSLLSGSSAVDLPLLKPEPPRRLVIRPDSPDNPPGVTTTGLINAPKIAKRVEPQYTEFARRAAINGTVVADAVIRKDGTASVLRIFEGLGFGLDENAQAAIEQWRFNPASDMRKGDAVDVRLSIEVTFNLR